MIKWRIYYDDFSTFDSTMGEAWERPGRGVICIVQPDPNDPRYNVNTQILNEFPFYWFHTEWGYWNGSSLDGILDQLLEDRKNVVRGICQGRWTSYPNYHAIMELARSDPDFMPKSGVSTAELRFNQ